MFYVSTKEGTGWTEEELSNWKVRLLYKLLFFVPKANPDNEGLYHLVDAWLLELNDSGLPTREIGLDSNGEPLFCAPDERNYGFWTDNPEDPVDQSTTCPIERSTFEGFWNQVARNA